MIVFHVSEEPDIEVFEPRKFEATGELFVWAIDDERLCNYLVPRDCPRVTFDAGPHTTDADRERFLGARPERVTLAVRLLRPRQELLRHFERSCDPSEPEVGNRYRQ